MFPNKKRKAKAIGSFPTRRRCARCVEREAESLGRTFASIRKGLLRIEVDFGEVQSLPRRLLLHARRLSAGYHRPRRWCTSSETIATQLRRVPRVPMSSASQTSRLSAPTKRSDVGCASSRDSMRRASAGPAVLGLPAPMVTSVAAREHRARHTQISRVRPGRGGTRSRCTYVDGTTLAIRVPGRRMKRFSHQDLEAVASSQRNAEEAVDCACRTLRAERNAPLERTRRRSSTPSSRSSRSCEPHLQCALRYPRGPVRGVQQRERACAPLSLPATDFQTTKPTSATPETPRHGERQISPAGRSENRRKSARAGSRSIACDSRGWCQKLTIETERSGRLRQI